MASFQIRPDNSRFDGYFTVALDSTTTPDPIEAAFRRDVNLVMARLAALRALNADTPVPTASLLRKMRQVDAWVTTLRTVAQALADGVIDAPSAAAEVATVRQRIEAIDSADFVVETQNDGEGRAVDIMIDIGAAELAQDKVQLYQAIDQALTVIKVAFAGDGMSAAREAQQRVKLDEYVRKLAGIASVGLELKNQTAFGQMALTSLTSQIAAREAAVVKNAYVKRLGLHSLVWAVAMWLVFVLMRQHGQPVLEEFPFPAFVLMAAGAAVGTWLSFALRRMTLGFADLASPEEDQLSPGLRIIFVMALTMVVGLLFYTGAVGIEMGTFKTGFPLGEGKEVGYGVAALIGALCGIAERGLATAVSSSAGQFIGGIGAR
ncbi:MAG: hypothetical protein BGP12_15710 [Rhodospirillales bacterium 70-18]|nr:hypothetical protein [Rhodospirillales bacterium]OJY63993.1 MAG: hypothetical protein BGP12_15710 [Rhodospirillales bacterium 70-18]